MKNLIWYMFAGTRGGLTRAKIVSYLIETPSNANKLSQDLNLDYKTIRHHLQMLEKNGLIYSLEKNKYGAVYFLSEQLNSNMVVLEEILNKIGINLGKN